MQVFETVIRGVGGLLSAHLFAVGELPINGYHPKPFGQPDQDDPLELSPIQWSNGFAYDGQLLRLALDLATRLLPAFYTSTGMPYPRVNLRHGIPFFPNSPLHEVLGTTSANAPGPADITETCSAGAGSLVLEFTVLSRLTDDTRFEQIAKRAFWSVWNRRSEIGLIGAGVDAEQGNWIGGHSVIGAGADSFFEYALKSHILLSGHAVPNVTVPIRPSPDRSWIDPNELWVPLTEQENSPDAFLEAWNQAHAAIKRHLYDDTGHPHYSNVNIMTGSLATNWIDSLGAYYPGLLTLAGELDEAMETNLLHAAIWTKYAALPERWSIKEKQVEGGLGWWPLRPEFIESTYHLYRATKDTWYLYVGEMVMKDINRRCRTKCGFAGLQNVVTGEQTDRMESFFLGETAKYLYLLYDDRHPLNSLDAAYVFTTEGHPLIIPKATRRYSKTKLVPPATTTEIALYYDGEAFTSTCPLPPATFPLTGSSIASRPDLFHAARLLDLHMIPNKHSGLVAGSKPGVYKTKSNHTYFPWTLPPAMQPNDGLCGKVPEATEFHLEFGTINTNGVLETVLGAQNLDRFDVDKIRVNKLSGLKLAMRLEEGPDGTDELRITRVNGFNLGRDEYLVLSRALLSDISDTKFKLIRDLTAVKIHHLYQIGIPERTTANDSQALEEHHSDEANEEQCPPPDIEDLFEQQDPADFDPERPQPAIEDNPSPPDAFATFIRSLWSRLNTEPSTPNPPPSSLQQQTSSLLAGVQGPLNILINTTAITPIGIGAAPLPPVDIPPTAIIPLSGPVSPHLLPWTTVFAAGHACDARLPEEAPRDHHIIVIRRGGCTFSEKLANIPAYKPSPTGLQLVIIVSSDEDDEGGPLSRPLLNESQRTPSGIQRRTGIPMVMVAGGEDMYRELTERGATPGGMRMGMTRRYYVESEGRRIANVIVDDGDTPARM